MKDNLTILTAGFPTPWTAVNHPDGAITVTAANNEEVLFNACYTGDGATIALSNTAVRAMVEIVNRVSLLTEAVCGPSS